MNKIIFSIGIFLLGIVSFPPIGEAAIEYSTESVDHWTDWIRSLPTRYRRYRMSSSPSYYSTPEYYNSRKRGVTTIIPAMPSRKASVWRSPSFTTPVLNVPSQALKLQVNPIPQRQTVSSVDGVPIRVFEIGVLNVSKASSTDFVEALLFDTIQFQMFSNTGVAADPTKFRLRVNYGDQDEESDFQFNSDGTVTVQFHNARIAKGESMKFFVSVVVDNPTITPHVPGSFRIRILGAEAREEQSRTVVTPVITGTSISETIAFNPTPSTSGTPVFSGQTSQQIYGRTLSAGEKAPVLALNFEAHYDDMMIEELTVRDTLSGGAIDSFVSWVQVIDTESGQMLGQTRFVGGEVRFRFWSPVRVNRGGSRSLAIQVQITNRVDISSQNTQFRLEVLPSDVRVSGYGSGRELSDGDKNFSVDAETFLVVNSGGALEVSPSITQPQGFPVTGAHTGVYRFTISGPSSGQVSIGRISLNITLEGLTFPGGRSADDFELLQIINDREVTGSSFTIQLGAGNTVIFDAGTELFMSRNQSAEFLLKLRLEDIPGQISGDSVAVQILGDTTFSAGTLASVRVSGANFIWSDHSGRPHAMGSEDWLSGYLLQGLPSGVTINYRQ